MLYGEYESRGVRGEDIQLLTAREYELQKIRTEWTLYRERERAVFREQEAEYKKSIYEEVFLREDGVVDVKTQNLRINSSPRLLCNFKYPEMTAFICIVDFSKIYCMSCFIGDKEKKVYFDERKGGNPSYFLRKLSSEGLEIMASTSSRKKFYAEKLWVTLIKNCKKEVLVPQAYGWFVTSEGKLSYFKEGGCILWKEISSRAK